MSTLPPVTALAPGITVRAALDTFTQSLADAQIEEPRRLARRILCHALDWPEASLITRDGECLPAEAAMKAWAMAQRAARHEPFSRIIGEREFFGLPFALGTDTLDPRPETEHLVELALAHLRAQPNQASHILDPHILDMGTGTGAILLSTLFHLPNARGLGTDIAPGAVAVARRNAAALGLEARADFHVADLFPPQSDSLFDAILSNPPYIATHDITSLMPEVREHDPHRALDGGADGLDFYRRIITCAPLLLKPGGLLAVEIGYGQAEDVLSLFRRAGFANPCKLRDYAGIDRVIHAVRAR